MPKVKVSARKTRLDGKQNAGREYCWAMTKRGTPCTKRCQTYNSIPYCSEHFKRGDDAFRIEEHPMAGKILVANHSLPKSYKSVYFGTRKAYHKCSAVAVDYALSYWSGGGVIDPVDYPIASKLQYMGNPGPNEKSNNTCSDEMFGKTRDNGCVGREYKLTAAVPKNSQLVQFYGNDWFVTRDIVRVDIGTKKFPAPLRKKRVKKVGKVGVKKVKMEGGGKGGGKGGTSKTFSAAEKKRRKIP